MSLSLARQWFRNQSELLGGSVRQPAPGEAASSDIPAAPPASARDASDDPTAAANRRELAKAQAAYAASLGIAPAVTAQVLASRERPAPTLPPAAQEAAERGFAKRIDQDSDGTVTVAELKAYDSDENQLRGLSLLTIIGAERRVIADSPALAAYQQNLARAIVRSGGSGTQEDIDAMLPTVAKLPIRILEAMKRAHITVVVCRGSVADYLPDLASKQPRGHARDSGWDHIPGAVNGKEVVIATMDSGAVDAKHPGTRILPPTGHGHGSYNVALHEIGHALNANFAFLYPEDAKTQNLCAAMTSDEVVPPAATPSNGAPSASADGAKADRPDYDVDALSSWSRSFLNARKADWDRELPYYQQEGKGPGAGGDETFAESFARYYGGDATLAWHWPKLYAFWDSNPFASKKIREGAAARSKGCAKAKPEAVTDEADEGDVASPGAVSAAGAPVNAIAAPAAGAPSIARTTTEASALPAQREPEAVVEPPVRGTETRDAPRYQLPWITELLSA